MTIWKYPLELTDQQTIQAPLGCKVLSVQMQNGQLTAWMLVNEAAPLAGYTFWVVGTGHPMPSGVSAAMHIGTVQQGRYVWHVFTR